MKYDIRFLEHAEQQLADIWLRSPDRAGVTGSSQDLERELSTDPLTFGESRESSVQRVGAVGCLGCGFVVIQDDMRVEVYCVFAVS